MNMEAATKDNRDTSQPIRPGKLFYNDGVVDPECAEDQSRDMGEMSDEGTDDKETAE